MSDPHGKPGSAVAAGVLYFAIAFGCGFALGIVRVLILMPLIGELAATALELPVMLAISWMASRWVIERVAVADGLGHRLAMGGLAFGLLMVAEAGLALGFGRTLAEHVASYGRLPQLSGLAAQVGFGLIPALQLRFRAIPDRETPLR